ncbi:MAG: hypothetical protein AABZ53_00085 [Planctomycetota bacterium]
MANHSLKVGALLVCFAASAAWLPGPSGPAPVQQGVDESGSRSVREFGVRTENTPEANRAALQKAIDWASSCGGEVRVEPSAEPYRVASGLVLRQNASLVGVHGPVGRGTKHPTKAQPVGSVLAIEDSAGPFLTVETATQVRGLQFWYPKQTLSDPKAVIAYPPTIQVSQAKPVWGVTLSCLTFYGEYMAMDFNASERHACEQILFEHCYGYPLGGEFIRIDRCYDVPRILHCHVNPANRRAFAGDCSKAVIDSVVAKKSFAYRIDHTDNAQLMDLFTFGTYGGAWLGSSSYGQLTAFNFDCVAIGIHKGGDSAFNRNWMVAQGSIIANLGETAQGIHPIVVEGRGHLAISNVEAFSGPNGALTALGRSQDFLTVSGKERVTVSMSGCRMRNYEADAPVTMQNPNATVVLTGCFDKSERACDGTLGVATAK